MKQIIILFSIATLIASCASNRSEPYQRQITINTHKEYDSTRNAEAREDSIKMDSALRKNATFGNVVWATAETDAVKSELHEDAADDPAIWINPSDPGQSLVLGSEKNSGIYVYDLEGNTQQFLPIGNINNVDVRSGFTYQGRPVSVVVGSNRSINSISVLLIDDETTTLSDTILNIKSFVDEVYGITLYQSSISEKLFAFVNGKGGKFEQWVIEVGNESIEYDLVRSFHVSSQPEGMVVNEDSGILYLGVEEYGIAKLSAEPDGDTNMVWIANSTAENSAIDYDIEGLAIYYGNNGNYLLASIQGNFSYAVWEITDEGEDYITNFVIWELLVDGVEETDGIEVTSVPLNSNYPKGMLVVQDGFNYDGDTLKTQNFKYISWEQIEEFLEAK